MCATFARADLQRLTRLLNLTVYCHEVTSSGRSGGRRLTNKELAIQLCNKDKHPCDSPAPRKPWVQGNTLGVIVTLLIILSQTSKVDPIYR
jgi:hypothetical protein